MSAKTEKVAFGSKRERFNTLGLHPSLNRNGAIILGPGYYEPKDLKCLGQVNGEQKQPWKRALDSYEYSKNMGFHNNQMLLQRKEMRQLLGPGSHDINFDCYKQQTSSKIPNLGFGHGERTNWIHDQYPGPGFSLILLNRTPLLAFVKRQHNARKSCSKPKHVGNTIGRDRRWKSDDKTWYLPCNRYDVKDPRSMESYVNRVVSLRGPYDLFTGPRTESNVFNKLAKGKDQMIDVIYNHAGSLDHLIHASINSRKGKFLKTVRFPSHPTARNMLTDLGLCYRRDLDPGPAQYVLHIGIEAVAEQKYPFGLSAMHLRHGIKQDCWLQPGPARYNLKNSICSSSYKRNHSSVFLSKTGRTEHKATIYNAF